MGTLHGCSPLEKFLMKVDRTGGPGECWTWMAATNSRGYGVFTVKPQERRPVPAEDLGCWLAHRFAFERLGGGVLDPDLTIDHLCENKVCVNPAHLEQVTREENTRRQMCRVA